MINLKKLNQNGSTMVASLIIVSIMASTALSVVSLNSTDSQASIDQMYTQKAFAVSNAGLQWAKDFLKNGNDARVVNKTFADGTFTVTTNTVANTVTSVSLVNGANQTQSMSAKFSDDCFEIDVDGAYLDSNRLRDFIFRMKSNCNDRVIINGMRLDWNVTNCAKSMDCNGNNFTMTGDETTCEASAQAISNLAQCAIDSNGIKVTELTLGASTIFKSGQIPTVQTVASPANVKMGTAEHTVTDTNDRSFVVKFDSVIDQGAFMRLTISFADQSEKELVFKAF